jgi:hypothetical protein
MITPIQAVDRIEREFPEIRDELRDEDWDGLIHLQVSVFGRRLQAAIDDRDHMTFQRACTLFLELFENGDPSLVNALNVSFLEHLDFYDGKRKRQWAYLEMPPKMRSAFDAMVEYNRRLHDR